MSDGRWDTNLLPGGPVLVGDPWWHTVLSSFTEDDRLAPDSERGKRHTMSDNYFKAGTPVLVEVHGLPHDETRTFTYLAADDVILGQQVQVPAPEWSIKVTGRAELPGYVLGDADTTLTPSDLRSTLPQPVYPKAGNEKALRTLVDEWREEADDLYRLAEGLHYRANRLESVINGHG